MKYIKKVLTIMTLASTVIEKSSFQGFFQSDLVKKIKVNLHVPVCEILSIGSQDTEQKRNSDPNQEL